MKYAWTKHVEIIFAKLWETLVLRKLFPRTYKQMQKSLENRLQENLFQIQLGY